MTEDFCKQVRAEWRKAFRARKGLVCIYSHSSSWREHFPPYIIDQHGWGVGFCGNLYD